MSLLILFNDDALLNVIESALKKASSFYLSWLVKSGQVMEFRDGIFNGKTMNSNGYLWSLAAVHMRWWLNNSMKIRFCVWCLVEECFSGIEVFSGRIVIFFFGKCQHAHGDLRGGNWKEISMLQQKRYPRCYIRISTPCAQGEGGMFSRT